VQEIGQPSSSGGHIPDRPPGRADPWIVARTCTSPELTARLLAEEPGFASLPKRRVDKISRMLTFLFLRTREWALIWAESVSGPARRYQIVHRIRRGVGAEEIRELARTVAFRTGASIGLLAANVSVALGREWSKFTNSHVHFDAEEEITRVLEFDVPPGGMDIALWQLEERLTRRLALRRGVSLQDPLPKWIDTALTVPVRSIRVPTAVLRTVTRTRSGD